MMMQSFIIVVNRMGGLGNQLFQYAAACAVAYHHPYSKIYVEPESENPHNYNQYEYADIFMKDAVHLQGKVYSIREFHQGNSFVPWHPEQLKPPIRLCGYFQYYPAIKPILPKLVKEFNRALQPFLDTTITGSQEQERIFMHIRRGDYLNLPHYHYIQDTTYYEKAYQQWKHQFKGDVFQVFLISEDPEWCCQQQWSFPYQMYKERDELKTLAFMSQCKAGAIIGNSSFSYWGAILSESVNVFYPEKWIAETVHDLFPSNWCCVTG